MSAPLSAEDFRLSLRVQKATTPQSGQFVRTSTQATWSAKETAFIVCDVWDKHHCLNAVRRMEEFLPRMNEILRDARRRGAVIIHSPSDCMSAYEGQAARQRAIDTAAAPSKPPDVEFWCSKIATEEQAVYPIDQSDGGEDDDPEEHANWASELKALGRNPGIPWKSQSSMIHIDQERDFISDRGDEVWNILEAHHINNVILVGVHTNMCVLGRPFGLRQMVRNAKNVALVRDMTDCMYNPKCWPYVDHFTGNDLIISHIERFICPTISSDQFLGGKPFVSAYDIRMNRDVMSVEAAAPEANSFDRRWTTVFTESTWQIATHGAVSQHEGPEWYRCALRIPSSWMADHHLKLSFANRYRSNQAWLNGDALTHISDNELTIEHDSVIPNDIHLLVVRVDQPTAHPTVLAAPILSCNGRMLELSGRWQFRFGDDLSWTNIPLPAKFGLGPDVLFEAKFDH